MAEKSACSLGPKPSCLHVPPLESPHHASEQPDAERQVMLLDVAFPESRSCPILEHREEGAGGCGHGWGRYGMRLLEGRWHCAGEAAHHWSPAVGDMHAGVPVYTHTYTHSAHAAGVTTGKTKANAPRQPKNVGATRWPAAEKLQYKV
eukprot:1162077-Pelagomonas_calceolata.AAC.8